MPKDSFTGMDKNNNMVIKPLGAINNKGRACNLSIFKNKKRITNILIVIAIAQTMVSGFSISLVLIRKPKSKKNKARIQFIHLIKHFASAVPSFISLKNGYK